MAENKLTLTTIPHTAISGMNEYAIVNAKMNKAEALYTILLMLCVIIYGEYSVHKTLLDDKNFFVLLFHQIVFTGKLL